ncbi:hypothetical protein CMT52_12315 [Elizabethkingia anophelis]|nr:hypothetical protein [Elizabethkingia anophelis]
MKVISFFLVLCFSLFNGQGKRFIYDYQYIPNKLKPKEVLKETMFLDVYSGKSEFYSYQKYRIDSTIVSEEKKGRPSMPPNIEVVSYRVIKNTNTKGTKFITKVEYQLYNVSDNRTQQWKISSETNKILGYLVQKAETDFAGRHWIAWFSKDIPIPDGPYKFQGLPGLILKLEDSTGSHKFLVKGINSLKQYIGYPQIEEKPVIKISQATYEKIYIEKRKDPVKNLRGRMPDQRDDNGNFISGAEALRESEKAFRKKIDADNNVIELDMLKK